jgi:hypothetical protein
MDGAVVLQTSVSTAQSLLWYLASGKVLATVFLCAWGLGVTIGHFRAKTPERKQDIEFLQRVWLGSGWGIVPLLLQLWLFTLALAVVMPRLRPLMEQARQLAGATWQRR